MRLFCQRASQEPCGNQIRSTETWLINIHQLVLYITYHSIHNNTHLVVVGTVGGLLDRGVLLTLAHGDADHGVHVDAGQVPRLDDCDADLGHDVVTITSQCPQCPRPTLPDNLEQSDC